MKKDISCVFEGIDDSGAIYISGIHAAQNLQLLKEKKIQAILTVAKGGRLTHSSDHIKHYHYIPAEDHEAYDISQFFNNTFEFIEKARRETNVLIHCMAGISRSATITAAYLMMKFGYEMNTVLNLLQRKRKQILPNPSFMRQLSQIPYKHRNMSKSIQAKQQTNASATLTLSKHGSHSIKKENTELKPLSSKYIVSYKGNKTPVRARNNANVALQNKDSNKRQKMQLKIDRVKNSLFSMMSQQLQQNGENGPQLSVVL